MKISFYDIKNKQQVEIDQRNIQKITYKRETSKGIQLRYALQGKTEDGRMLPKFVNKATYESINAPEKTA